MTQRLYHHSKYRCNWCNDWIHFNRYHSNYKDKFNFTDLCTCSCFYHCSCCYRCSFRRNFSCMYSSKISYINHTTYGSNHIFCSNYPTKKHFCFHPETLTERRSYSYQKEYPKPRNNDRKYVLNKSLADQYRGSSNILSTKKPQKYSKHSSNVKTDRGRSSNRHHSPILLLNDAFHREASISRTDYSGIIGHKTRPRSRDQSKYSFNFSKNIDNDYDGSRNLCSNEKMKSTAIEDDAVVSRDDICEGTTEYVEGKSIQPMGFKNPRGFCFLNCVLQVLRGCVDFTTEILKLSFTKVDSSEDANLCLLKEICQLFKALNDQNSCRLNESLNNIQNYFTNEAEGDDVNKCYLQLLKRLLMGLQKIDGDLTRVEPIQGSNRADIQFDISKQEKRGFIFDLFFGQMAMKTKCYQCSSVLDEKYSLYKSIALPVQKSGESTSVAECIASFLTISEIVGYDGKECHCSNGPKEYGLEIEITHTPKYLLLYLNRGSYYKDGQKNNDLIGSDNVLKLPTTNGLVNYKLISVIDHVGDNVDGHYYCKCNYEGDKWWIISDTQVSEAGEIVTKNTIAFFYKRI